MSARIRYWLISIAMAALFAGLVYVGSILYGNGALKGEGQLHLTMLAIALGTFVSEDIATITSGLLAASGKLTYWHSVAAAYSGIFIGDLIIFWFGYHFGRPFLAHKWSRFLVSAKAVERASQLFKQKGVWLIIITRFLPGTRTATYFAAGALHASVTRFVPAFALAAGLWTPFLVGLSFLVGRELLDIYKVYEALALPALILAGLLLYLVFHYGIPMFTWKGRRRLKGKWIRATRWEFWPWWQVYWLVILYILYLGFIRFRSPTLFTLANPVMPFGGFIGESKSAILGGLKQAGPAILPWARIETGTVDERMTALAVAMDQLGMDYPVVLKPDEGQRGASVGIIHSSQQARSWFQNTPLLAIVQQFAEGNEYGVFYIRRPSGNAGRVTSITIKKQLTVAGDGVNNLEHLILSHPRAIALLDTFLDRYSGRLREIPGKGEVIRLGELGTHARGSLFLDGKDLITAELETAMDDIASGYEGFYFGRFDIKVPDEDSLKRGENIRVIELNGVSSEETHIYDPHHGLLNAWKTLCRQWDTAFEIASENRKAGYEPASLGEFFRNLKQSRQRQRVLD